MSPPSHNSAPASAIVVGGGVGGLAAAIHLARAGLRVRLFERAPSVGGKLREVEVGGRRFDAGPSVLTMRWVFDELFDGRLDDYLRLLPLDPLCRHFFDDGSRLDLHADEERSREAIAQFAGTDAGAAYARYRKHAARIFEIVRGPFMEQPLPSMFDLLSPRVLMQLTQIDGMRTLSSALEYFFRDPRLRQLFGRYATYNGSSPYHAPATLAVIAHVENSGGIFACAGGLYRLAEALAARAGELGVEVHTSAEIESLDLEPGHDVRVRGVRVGGELHTADIVVANCDVAHLYEQLLPPQFAKLAARHGASELSLSAYVLLAVAPSPSLPLAHHNVFFSADYQREFRSLVRDRRPPEDPTVYVCAQDRAEGAPPAAGAERFFLLSNAAPLDERGARVDWTAEGPRCRDRIEARLARHGWRLGAEAATAITPAEMAERFPSSRGALYGMASNSRMAAFKRPANRVPGVRGLFAAGGSTHPGAGLPMVALSGRMAARMAMEELRS